MVSHLLDDTQKNHQRASAIEPLELLPEREASDFHGIATGDELWFQHHYEAREMLAASQENCHLLFGLSWRFKKL
jgi:hypothetical protein